MRSLHSALLWVFLALAACKSPARKLDEFLKEGRFAEARALLEEDGVGAAVDPKASPEAVAMRARFTADIESGTRADIERLLGEGAAHRARDKAHERQSNCSWSTEIRRLVDLCDGHVAAIGAAEATWLPLLDLPSASAVDARRFFAEIAPGRPWIMDSDVMRRLDALATGAVVREWAAIITSREARLSTSEHAAMRTELSSLGLSVADNSELDRALSIVSRLPATAATDLRLSAECLEALREARAELGRDGNIDCMSRLAPCVDAAWSVQGRWMAGVFPVALQSSQVTSAELTEADAWTEIENHGAPLRQFVARAHSTAGARRAPEGSAAVLGLLHLVRAKQLGLPSDDAQLVAATELARSTRAAQTAPVFRLDVNLGPRVEPEVRGLVLSAFVTQMKSPSQALAEFDYMSLDEEQPRVVVTVTDATLVFDLSNLRAISSRYFSHFETVPNLRKSQIKIDLDSAEWTVDSKQRAYSSAVNSHNIWPTTYSLNNVNWAYTSYSSAVDNYNFLVGLYNATPSTISQAVYLPYSFREGQISYGWTASATVQVGRSKPLTTTHESVDSDFVRIGNKGTDEAEAYRADDPLDIDLSSGAGLGHLRTTIDRIKQDMMCPLAGLAFEPTANLDSEESKLLGWLYHPWGVQPEIAEQLGVPNWAQLAAAEIRWERQIAPPPPLQLPPSPEQVQVPLDTEAASQALNKFVCLVRSSGKEREATGTATLVGPDGLMLTCAHVLVGSTLRLEFSTGPWEGIHPGELLFVNTQHDVALVRANGLANDCWADVRLDRPSSQGEPLVAIGNPGMGVGGANIGGMSTGIVSNPHLDRDGDNYVSADIAVASGSSGGPLFSLKDGSLVGVIQCVATSPGLAQEGSGIAASGFLCLAAPGHMLDEWLGLRRPD